MNVQDNGHLETTQINLPKTENKELTTYTHFDVNEQVIFESKQLFLKI